jgi:hypothetical protein
LSLENYTDAIIRKTPNKNEWCVYSKDGNKNLGCSPTKEGALKRLRQIEHFKRTKGTFSDIDDAVLATLFLDDMCKISATYHISSSDKKEWGFPQIHYISDGSIYFDSGEELIEMDDPMITDPIKIYDDEFNSDNDAYEMALSIDQTPRVTEKYFRFRQKDPKLYDKFRVIDISDGIKAIIGIVDGKSSVQSYLFDRDKFSEKEAIDWLKKHGKKYS